MTTDSTTTEEAPPGYARRWWVLATMTVCLLVVIMGNTILNVALPTLQRELGATQGELQWAVDSYILVFAGLLFSWGVLGDRIGRRKVLLIGLAVFSVGSVLSYADDHFNTMLEIGFGTSIRREWDWRVKRGESLRNLEAFAAFADPSRRGDAAPAGGE